MEFDRSDNPLRKVNYSNLHKGELNHSHNILSISLNGVQVDRSSMRIFYINNSKQ